MDKTDFAARMKMYEKLPQQRFLPLLPICIRLDGRSFSRWTRCMKRPYDEDMMQAMLFVTSKLVEETNAVIGYTQSDEISLILYSDDINSQVYFDGKIQKIISSTAAFTTAVFNEALPIAVGAMGPATFDCRAWQVPNKVEATNVLLWRELDATKNSISMAARSVYSHKELHKKNGKEMQDMLVEKGINWNDYPDQFKRGVFVQKKSVLKDTPKSNIPVARSAYKPVEIPPFSKVRNRLGVVFDRERPVIDNPEFDISIYEGRN